jgi:hypothetical protein
LIRWLDWFMVLNATFNNISAILWRSVLLVEETRVPGKNHRPVASHWQTLSHNVVSSTTRHEWVQTHNVSGDRHWLLIHSTVLYHSYITITPTLWAQNIKIYELLSICQQRRIIHRTRITVLRLPVVRIIYLTAVNP